MKEREHEAVATIEQDAHVSAAALRFGSDAVGALVVVDERQRPVGMLTDRDVTIRVVAAGLVAADPRVRDVMSQPLITADPDDALDAILVRMHQHGVRRVPLVRGNKLVGIVALDDVLSDVAQQLHDLASAADRELRQARRQAAFDELRQEFEERLNQALGVVGQVTGEAEKVVARVVRDLREGLQRTFRRDEPRGR